MHELSIALSIIELAEQEARKRNATVIDELELEIGQFAGVEVETLLFALESSVKGTMLENARIIHHSISGEGKCLSCDNGFNIKALHDACPVCHSYGIQLLKGKELRVKSILIP